MTLASRAAVRGHTFRHKIGHTLRVTDFFMDLMTGDLSNQQAVQRVHDTEGPSISWLVGHLLNGRCEMLKLLDSSAENPFAA